MLMPCLDVHGRVWAGRGSGKPRDLCGQVISRSQVEYEFKSGDGRTVRLHFGCASPLEGERRVRAHV